MSNIQDVQLEDLGIGQLFWTIHEAVVVADAFTNTIVLWNPAAEEVFGYSVTEALGQPTEILIPQVYRAQHQAGMTHYRATGNGRVINSRKALELPALHKTGREITIELTLNRLHYPPEPERYVLALIRDVTERKQAQIELQQAKELAESALQQLREEQEKSERLLLNILPKPIADRLKDDQITIADSFEEATVLFADIVNFTLFSGQITPPEVVGILNTIFSTFDRLVERYGLEKIKTIGDAYMVVGGLPTPRPEHVEAIADLALDMQAEIANMVLEDGTSFQLCIGIHTGPVVAGVIGTRKFIYDLWGDTVNTASRMESQGLANAIQVTEVVYQRLHDRYRLTKRGTIHIKGKGEMTTYLLCGRESAQGLET